MTLGQLQVEIAVTGAQAAVQQIQSVGAAVQAAGNTASGGGGIGGMNKGVFDLTQRYQDLKNRISGAAQMAGDLTGIGIAAQYEQIRMSIETVTGSAESASRALENFK